MKSGSSFVISMLLLSGMCLGKSHKPHKPQHKPQYNKPQHGAAVAQAVVAQTNVSRDQIKSAVTYEFSGGRFGDNLVAYIHAKWLAYRYNVDVLYRPFPYSDQLMLHTLEQHYDPSLNNTYQSVIKHAVQSNGKSNASFNINPKGYLYVVPYFPECMEEYRQPDTGIHPMTMDRFTASLFVVDWEDQKFLELLRQAICPRQPMTLVCPPTDCISVAVHVRKNSGGFDNPLLQDTDEANFDPNMRYDDVGFPLKHVPDTYHVEQLKYLAHMFNGQKIYAFIFTDDPNPERLAAKYAQEVNNDQIVFDYRREENGHTANVLEDLFSMMNFDCLIRGDSNLVMVAARLGHFKVVISPLHHTWKRTKLFIDKVSIIINNNF